MTANQSTSIDTISASLGRGAWQAGASGQGGGPRLAGAPGSWRRVVTGSIGALLVLGGLLILGAAAADDASCDPETEWFCGGGTWLAFYWLTLPLWIVAAPFLLATVVPFSTFRRILVGVGSAMLAVTAVLVAAVILGATGAFLQPGLLLVTAVVVFCLACWAAR